MTVAVRGDAGAHWYDALLEPGRRGARRRREDDIPDLAVNVHFHRGVRAAQAEWRFDRTGDLELGAAVTRPAMMCQDQRR